jgi:hypothetical protein
MDLSEKLKIVTDNKMSFLSSPLPIRVAFKKFKRPRLVVPLSMWGDGDRFLDRSHYVSDNKIHIFCIRLHASAAE